MATAFVLSGGGNLGAVQVGMLAALAERDIVPDLLVGTSVGALNAAYLAAGPSPRRIAALAELWRSVRRRDVFPSSVTRTIRAVRGSANAVVDPGPLRSLIERQLGYARLEDAPWPVAVVATEVTTGMEVVLTRGDAVAAVLASTAIPAVFPPVELGGHLLMDGGLVNNAPISAAQRLGADRVFVLPTGYACALHEPPRSAVGMALHAVSVAVQRRLITEVEQLQGGQLALRVVPPLCPVDVGPTDFSRTGELIDRARRSTAAWLDRPVPDDQTVYLGLHEHHAPAPTSRRGEPAPH